MKKIMVVWLAWLWITGADAFAGGQIVKGPPWHTSYKTARREALREGKPVFIYYTKTV